MVVSTNVMYARFYASATNKEAHRNLFRSMETIMAEQGIRGFYRGFVPTMLLYAYSLKYDEND